MPGRTMLRVLVLAAVLPLVGASCGGDSDGGLFAGEQRERFATC